MFIQGIQNAGGVVMANALPKVTDVASLRGHWLVQAALAGEPGRQLPTNVQISPTLMPAWRQVAKLFAITADELSQRVATAYGLQVTDLADFQPNDGSFLPEKLCRDMGLVPLRRTVEAAYVAIADPRLTQDQLNVLNFAAKNRVILTILCPEDIDTCQMRLFSASTDSREHVPQIDLLAGSVSGEDRHVVRLMKAIFRAAIDQDASDVHIHPFVGGGAVRFRIDGILRRIATIPAETLAEIPRYLSANAGLEVNPLKPRDGRLRLKYGQRVIDLRLSVLPVHDGERIVCRLLDQGRSFSLRQSGLAPSDEHALRRMVANSTGMVLMTGPTGSGKTTTLYALLTSLNRVDVNIMTIEDPVEYVLPGVSQVQVNTKQGLSFADTLRSILRQDPDIVLVGEVRDSETARIAAQAALTGHLVLSTLHTNDVLGTVPRLLDLGLEASTLADALIGVVSQRLVRKLCEHCRQPATANYSPGEAEFLRIVGEAPAFRSVGCEHCDLTGFKGRLPVIERLEITPAIRQSLLSGIWGRDALLKAADSSLRSMAASARDWIVSGNTSPEEVQRVLGIGFWNGLGTEYGINPSNMAVVESDNTTNEGRLSLLLITEDASLPALLADRLDYSLVCASSAKEAQQILKSNRSIVGLIIDGQLITRPEEMLASIRAELAWSGLPVLFITSDDSGALELRELLIKFNAHMITREQALSDSLASAVTTILRNQ